MFLVYMTLCFGVLVLKGISGADCPDGFESHHGNCYLFSRGEETWTGAFASCQFFGSKLLEIDSTDEEDYISKKIGTLGDENYWIGLTDKLVENEYVWETSMQNLNDTGFTNWASGQPNGMGKENCVYYNDDNQWADAPCYRTERYICEKGDNMGEIVG